MQILTFIPPNLNALIKTGTSTDTVDRPLNPCTIEGETVRLPYHHNQTNMTVQLPSNFRHNLAECYESAVPFLPNTPSLGTPYWSWEELGMLRLVQL
jgi:hypothetical protein